MKTIIEMAREADVYCTTRQPTLDAMLERFAALVRADERDRAMRENAYVAAEREACAKLLETTDLGGMSADPKLQNWTAALLFNYAAAIRARGQA